MKPEIKRASWIELFYDIAYVALVAQLTYLAADYHHTPYDFIHIGIIGYAIFIAWWTTTANRNLQPSEDAGDKFMIQLQMVGAFMLSVTMSDVFAGDYFGFFITLGILRLLQTSMILRMYVKHPHTRPRTYNMTTGFALAGFLWLATSFASPEYYLALSSMALLLDITVPLTKGRGNTRRYLNVYHLQERLGLFLMLVIGESMIVVALSNSVESLVVSPMMIVFSGLGMMIALWWLYFEHSDIHNGIRPKNLFVFIHAHGLLYGSIILISVAYKLILAGQNATSCMSAFGHQSVAGECDISQCDDIWISSRNDNRDGECNHRPILSNGTVRQTALF
jgi:low temperature requirement protein LtrA